MKGLQAKVAKGAAAALDVLLKSVRLFGVRVVKPGPLLKAAASLLDHKDGAVREGVKDISVRRVRRRSCRSSRAARLTLLTRPRVRRWSWRAGWARRR